MNFIFCDVNGLSLFHYTVHMKYIGSILEFTRDRNADLMRAFREQLASARHVIMPEIFKMVADSPASRFWVSEKRAVIVISAMAAGKPMPRMRSNKREMFEEIYRRFLIENKKNPQKTIYELVTKIIYQPAPKFYFTPRTVGEIIYRIKKGWYERQFDRNRKDIDRE